MPKTRRKQKKEDRRGKHTKASREKKRIEDKRFFDSITSLQCCIECNGVDFVPTDDGDTNVCTGCGLVCFNRIIEGTTDVLLDIRGSAPYRPRNYFAERLRQARGIDPKFTTSQENKINVVWSMLHDRNRNIWSGRAKSFSKYRFRQICGVLDEMEPGKRWKQKLEKWWQARTIIYGEDPSWQTIDDITSMKLKILFDPFACYFSTRFKRNSPGSHNIPKMDLIILVLLYNISEETLQNYGWYFLSKNIIWPTESTLKDYARIKEITACVNEEFMRSSKKPFVRSQSYAWFHKNRQYEIPDLDYLIWLAYDSPEGRSTYNQFCIQDDPLHKINIVLV